MTQVHSFNKVQLRKNINATFSLNELETLFFDLDIDADNIAGANKEAKIINLIGFCQRRGGLLDLITALEASRPNVEWRPIIDAQSSSPATVEARIKHRQQIKEQSEKIHLVHTIIPSKRLGGYWDILIYLIREKSEDLSMVSHAEFFLGRYWNNEIFSIPNQDDFIGITISAYGPVLCTCRVVFTDGREAMLSRYIDFEMTGLFSKAHPGSEESTSVESPNIVIDANKQSELETLMQKMVQNFDRNELQVLALDLNIGLVEPPLNSKDVSRELIREMERQRRLPELLSHLEKNRPHVQWKE